MRIKLSLKLSGMFLFILLCAPTYAQVVKITGKVTDAKTNQPVPGATVAVKGMQSNVATNIDGNYTIQANPATDILVFSFVGYKRQEIKLAGRTNVYVSMAEEQNALNEVVVVGYGTKKRSEILGSVATITGAELQDIPAPNIAGALRNRIAGVGVDQTSGRPGAPIRLDIRGASSTTSDVAVNNAGATSEPLYVVDGITVTSDAFNAIDLSMVENITFLKDAQAAIYGASGAKGVVLVTTKRGKIGKPTLTYNGYYGVSDAARTPELLSAYDHAVLLNDKYRSNGDSYSNFFAPADLEYLKTVNYPSLYDQIWRSSTVQRHNLSISGGSEKITFFAGGAYQTEGGNYGGLKVDKYSFRTGVVADIVKGLKADINFNVDWNVRNQNYNGTDQDQTQFQRIIQTPLWVPNSQNGMYTYLGSNAINIPAQQASGYKDSRNAKGYRINASLNYAPEFLKGFSARLQISQSSSSTNSRLYIPPYNLYNFARFGNNQLLYTDQLQNNGSTGTPIVAAVAPNNQLIRTGLADNNQYQGFFTMQYGRTFGKHTFNVLAGGEQSEANDGAVSVQYTNQLVPGAEDSWGFDATTLTRNDISRSSDAKRSFFGRASYDYDKKYLLEFIIRADASSRFPTSSLWGVSPNVGLGWVISQENFMKKFRFISFLKLKANLGITGDDRITRFLWKDRYLIDVTNGYLYGEGTGGNTNALNPQRIANPNLTWDKKRTFNIGLESSLFNGKVDFGVEVFQNYTYNGFDQSGNQGIPLYAGLQPALLNYYEAYNWGTEVTIGYKATLAKNLNLSTNINFSYGNSVVTQILYNKNQLFNNVGPDWIVNYGTDPRRYNSSNLGYQAIGMFRTQAEVDAWMAKNPNYRGPGNSIPQAGWLYFEDSNGDGVINDADLQPMYDNTAPWFAPGISLNLSYKAFSLSTNILARFGGKVFYDGQSRQAPSATANVLSIWKDRWTPENPQSGWLPRLDDPGLGRASTYWAVNGTLIRVNNMTLSYKAPTKLMNKIGVSGARILLTGNNLWTIVNPLSYKDPYTNAVFDYPILRTISLGLSVNL